MTTRCLVYADFSFTGRGPAQSCASIVENFLPSEVAVEVFLGRTRRALAPHVRTHQALPLPLRLLPWRLVGRVAQRLLVRKFSAALRRADPADTVVYLWPDPPVDLVHLARSLGFVVVREMINCACATSGPLLDAAYANWGLPPTHGIDRERIERESAELRSYDYVFASNPEVEASLSRLGIDPPQVLPTSFGWCPERFAGERTPKAAALRVLFVGSIGVRKGIPELLQAWQDADLDGELVLAGPVEPSMADLLARAPSDRVRVLGFVEDIGELYRSADIFVFPTLEEGGPQVTYEAAGCGLPIITTEMGAARLVETGLTGIVVEAGSVAPLTEALRTLGADPALRDRYGRAARARSTAFDYVVVGRDRGRMLADVVKDRG